MRNEKGKILQLTNECRMHRTIVYAIHKHKVNKQLPWKCIHYKIKSSKKGRKHFTVNSFSIAHKIRVFAFYQWKISFRKAVVVCRGRIFLWYFFIPVIFPYFSPYFMSLFNDFSTNKALDNGWIVLFTR